MTDWRHVDDELPPFGEWVLVGGHSAKRGAWWLCGERVMEQSDWGHWSAALADCLKAAPERARAWLGANREHILRLRAKHPAWVAKLEALAGSLTGGGASGSQGREGPPDAPLLSSAMESTR